MKRQFLRGAMTAAAAMAILSCSENAVTGVDGVNSNDLSADASRIATIGVTLASPSIQVGDTTRAVAQLYDYWHHRLYRIVSWQSSNPDVASVDSTGLITGLAAGTSSITASAGTKSGSAMITVIIGSAATVASVNVALVSSSLIAGQTTQATATTYDSSNNVLTGRAIAWSSSDTLVARVSSSGVVSALAAGTSQIIATSEGKQGTAALSVSAPQQVTNPGAVTDLKVVGTDSTGVTLSFTQVDDGTAHPAEYDVRYAPTPIAWGSATSATSGTCSVPVVGTAIGSPLVCKILGLAPSTQYDFQLVAFRGTMNFNAVYGALSNVASGKTSTVAPPAPTPVASVTVSPPAASISVGATTQLSATTRDANNNVLTGRVITWTSSSTAIATVSASGVVTGVAAGTATITATSETKTGTSSVTVTAVAPVPVASVSVSPATASVPAGQTVQLSATTRDANNNVLTGRAISWTSSNSGVATVSGSGLVTAVATGSAQITATSENQSGSASISVTAPPPPPPSGSVEPAGMTPITENSFTTATEDGWYFEYGQTNAQIVQDPSAPRSPSGVLQLTYPAGMTGGTGPNSLERDWASGTYKTLYVSSWMKLSSNFYGHCGPDVTKTLHIWVSDGTTSGNRLYTNVRGCGSGPLSAWVNLQGVVAGGNVDNGTSAEFGPNLGQPATIVRGQWQHYELVIKANSAGTADGTIDWWLDGVHVGSYGGIQYVPGNATWDLMKWNPTWGGLGGVVPADFTESMDHIYVSGKR